jgi:phenylacetate-CoA ligase
MADAHEWFLRRVLLPLGDYALGQRMIRRLAYLETAQWWDREQITAQRDALLSQLVSTAYEEVPFYHSLFDRHSVTPQEIRRAEDLARLPVVTKDAIREHYPNSMRRATGQKVYESHTSGSTGKNFAVLEDRQTAGWYRASLLLALEWAGWRIGARHMQTGLTSRTFDRRLKDFALRCRYVPASDLTDATLDQHLSWFEQTKTRYLFGYPQSIYCLAARARATGCDISLSSVVTWGDTVFPEHRELIEEVFHTQLFDTYGCGEGIQIAAQCGHGPEYHIHALDVIVEYLDDHMEPVPPGERGNIVVTRLHPGPMPLIRYKIGDVGSSAGAQQCSCGRGFELMKSLHGRESDVIVTPYGNRLIVEFFAGIMQRFQEIDTFQVVQQTPSSLVVRVVPRSDYSATVGEALRRRLLESGAGGMSIDIQTVEEIPLTPGGKRRFVINLLNEEKHPSSVAEPTAQANTSMQERR